MTTTEQCISFDTAKLAKDKGFKLITGMYYQDGVDLILHHKSNINNNQFPHSYEAPTQSGLQKWLRKEHQIDVIPHANYNTKEKIKTYRCGVIFINDKNQVDSFFIRPEAGEEKESNFVEFNTYEEALEVGFIVALKLI